jgi:putative oxidoreductase
MTYFNVGLLIIRLVVGLTLAGHGSQKLFGWFGGPGLDGTTKMMEKLNIEPPRLWAWANALAEFFGGLGLALGLLTPFAAVALVGAMLVAIFKVHWPNFWNSKRGLEYPLVMGLVSFAVGLIGAGLYSLDYLLGLPLRAPLAYAIALGLMLLVVAWILVQSSQAQQTPEHEPSL